MTMYSILCEIEPFPEIENEFKMFQITTSGIRPNLNETDLPTSVQQLIQRCWSQNSNDRPDFVTIVDELKGGTIII